MYNQILAYVKDFFTSYAEKERQWEAHMASLEHPDSCLSCIECDDEYNAKLYDQQVERWVMEEEAKRAQQADANHSPERVHYAQ